MILVLVLSFVFIVGTFSFVGNVEATKWKKIDSGKFKTEYPVAGYKNDVYYKAFAKGENKIFYETYFYPKKGNAKKLAERVYITKNKSVISENRKDYFSKENEIIFNKTNLSAKKFYKNTIKNILKVSTTPPEKLAFDTEYFLVSETIFSHSFKLFGIKLHKNHIIAYIYDDDGEYCTKIFMKNKKITYKEYNQKRQLIINETSKTRKTISNIYKNKKNQLIKKINTKIQNEKIGKITISKNEAIEQAKSSLNGTGYSMIGNAILVKSKGKQYWAVDYIERGGRPCIMLILATAK